MNFALSEGAMLRLSAYAFLALSFYALALGPPAEYPQGKVIVIPSGATITDAADMLKEEHAIRSASLFSIAVRFGRNSVVAGSYLLHEKENVFSLAYRLSRGKTGLTPLKVTIPEGTSVWQAAAILKNTLGDFDSAGFTALAKSDEGYLFPDTYFLTPGVAPETVIQVMKNNFDRRVRPLKKDIEAFDRSESDVIIMASLLEKEARQSETRRTIAGILWKRLQLGMPLQVDAVFGYIFDRDTYSPSPSDLEVDSPYNTYKYKGLPPGPINNPGIEAIEDAITPIKTPYLYYLTDKEGNIHYAKTFAEHVANQQKIH